MQRDMVFHVRACNGSGNNTYKAEITIGDPYACPSMAENFSNLAPAIVVTAQYDPLKADGVKYGTTIAAGGSANVLP